MTIDISDIKTLQDVINVLNVVYFNMNEIERIYYDMFINPVPMDVTFQRYDDEGKLETITLPNRAKDRINTLSGKADPEGTVEAGIGAFYVNTTTSNLFFKAVGIDAFGWVLIDTEINLKEGIDYISPTGDASQLQNLNMNNARTGLLSVGRGGTGAANLTGLIKGNGTSACTAAIDGVDYLGPAALVGVICYYPVAHIPTGWLVCDGKAYSRTTYARLFNIIGTTYGSGDGSTTFNVPNLMDDGNGNPFYVRCWDGESSFNSVQQDQVGVHTHPLGGTSTGTESQSHQHARGSMEISGSFTPITKVVNMASAVGTSSGAFYQSGTQGTSYFVSGGAGAQTTNTVEFRASRSWTGATANENATHTHPLTGHTGSNVVASGTETRVLSKMLVPIIKY